MIEHNQAQQSVVQQPTSVGEMPDFIDDGCAVDEESIANGLLLMMEDMRLGHMAKRVGDMLDDASIYTRSAWDFAQTIFQDEWARRMDARIKRSLKAADLRYPNAVIDESISDPERGLDVPAIKSLAECEWISEGQNLLITGLTGAGKTYLACALGVSALEHSMHVRYIPLGKLLDDLAVHAANSTLNDAVDALAKPDLLIIDDFGLCDINHPGECNLLRVIDARDERKSMLIVSQLLVSEWYDLFPSPIYADAVLDRLTSRAHRIVMNGPSIRKSAR